MGIEIKSRFTGEVLRVVDAANLRDADLRVVRACVEVDMNGQAVEAKP